MVAFAVPALRHLREAPASAALFANVTMDVAPAEMLGPLFYNRPGLGTAFAVSPDGTNIVFSGEVKSPTRTEMLYKRPLSEAQAAAIPGTEGAEYPFFSPDGQWSASGNKLKKVGLRGGPPIDICDYDSAKLWTAPAGDAEASSCSHRGTGLWTVADSGGKPEALVDKPNVRLLSPQILPDGHSVLFTETAADRSWEEAQVHAVDLSTKQQKTVLTNGVDARDPPTGHLVFMRNAALLAAPFDATRAEVVGPAVPLLPGVMQSTNAPNGNDETGMGQFAISDSGILIYASGDRYPTPSSTLVRVDRKGTDTKLAEVKGDTYGIRISPSGSRLLAIKTNDGSRASDLWMYELPSGAAMRITSTARQQLAAVLAGWQERLVYQVQEQRWDFLVVAG